MIQVVRGDETHQEQQLQTCVYISVGGEDTSGKTRRRRKKKKQDRTTEFQRETIDLVQSFNLHVNKLGPQ